MLFILKSTAPFVYAFSLSLFLGYTLKKIAKYFSLEALPSLRKQHDFKIPLIGGIQIFLSLFLTAVLFKLEFQPWILPVFLILCIGVLDDRFQLSAPPKFIVQFLVAALTLKQIDLSSYVSYFHLATTPLAFLFIVGMMNAINMLDGLDELAIKICALSLLSLIIIQPTLLDAVFFSSLCGFYYYNRTPAKAYLGDAGSLFLGYWLSLKAINVATAQTPNGHSLFGLFLCLSYPVIDAIQVTLRRIVHKQNPFRGDRNHFHHEVQKWGHSPKNTVALLSLCAFLLCTVGVLSLQKRLSTSESIFSLWMISIFFSFIKMNLKQKQFLKLKIPESIKSEKNGLIFDLSHSSWMPHKAELVQYLSEHYADAKIVEDWCIIQSDSIDHTRFAMNQFFSTKSEIDLSAQSIHILNTKELALSSQ